MLAKVYITLLTNSLNSGQTDSALQPTFMLAKALFIFLFSFLPFLVTCLEIIILLMAALDSSWVQAQIQFAMNLRTTKKTVYTNT